MSDLAPSPPVNTGDVVAGKYRVDRVLGAGGMGIVVQATHLQLEQRVAIKFLLPEALQNAEALRRFIQEARAAARIESEYVARVHDVATLDTGAPYLVMEYLEGNDLSQEVEKRGKVPFQEAVDYVLQACDAIAEAHSVGIIHRDLKPANLFLCRRSDGSRRVKVLDFGISKLTPKTSLGGAAEASMTKTRALMGSPLYMAPEQMRSTKTVTARADIWALGIILYELVAGEPPFMGESMPEICAMVLSDPLPDLRTKRADVPEGFQAILARSAEKNPEARFATVADFAEALLPFASPRGGLLFERIARIVRGAAAEGPLTFGGSRPSITSTPELFAGRVPTTGADSSGSFGGGAVAVLALANSAAQTGALPAVRAATLASFGGTADPAQPRKKGTYAAMGFAGASVMVLVVVVVLVLRHGAGDARPAAAAGLAGAVTAVPPSAPMASASAATQPSATIPSTSIDAGVSSAVGALPPARVSPAKPARNGLASPSRSPSASPASPPGKPAPASTAGFGHGLD